MTSDKKKVIFSIILIVFLIFISFSSSLDNGFTNWDDPDYVIENNLIRELSWSNTKEIFTTLPSYTPYYHPLVYITYALEYSLFGLKPSAYHATNLLLHISNTLLVFWLILMLSNKISISLISALLFGVHPLHVESVAWITERKDVLSTFFFLQAIIYYLIYKKKNSRYFYCSSLSVFILSILSKPMVVTLPLVLLLSDYLLNKEFNRKNLLEKVPFFILSVICGVATTFTVTTDLDSIYNSAGSYEVFYKFFNNLLVVCWGVVFYLIKTIAPFNLSAFYSYPKVISIMLPEFFLPPLMLLIIAIAIFYSRRWTRKVVFGSLFFLVTVMPVLKVIPIGSIGSTFAADRYMYIPSIGLFYIVGWAFYKMYFWEGSFEKLRKLSLVIFQSVLILTFSVLTYQRNNIWQDSETLWKDTIAKVPDSDQAHNNLGAFYNEKGLFDQGIKEFKEVLRINPHSADTHYNLGIAYVEKGLLDAGVEAYLEAIRFNPMDSRFHYNLGIAYAENHLLDDAIKAYRESLRLNPKHLPSFNNLGNTFADKGLFDEAIIVYQKALKMDPNHPEIHYNLGLTYVDKGLLHDAIDEYRNVIKSDPNHYDAIFNLALSLENIGDKKGSIEFYKKFVEIAPLSSKQFIERAEERISQLKGH